MNRSAPLFLLTAVLAIIGPFYVAGCDLANERSGSDFKTTASPELLAKFPNATPIGNGGYHLYDSTFTFTFDTTNRTYNKLIGAPQGVEGYTVRKQRWVYPKRHKPHDENAPWLEGWREFLKSTGRDPSTPWPHDEFERLRMMREEDGGSIRSQSTNSARSYKSGVSNLSLSSGYFTQCNFGYSNPFDPTVVYEFDTTYEVGGLVEKICTPNNFWAKQVRGYAHIEWEEDGLDHCEGILFNGSWYDGCSYDFEILDSYNPNDPFTIFSGRAHDVALWTFDSSFSTWDDEYLGTWCNLPF